MKPRVHRGVPSMRSNFATYFTEDPDVSVNRRGESVVLGLTRLPVDFGTGTLFPDPLDDIFLLKLER